MWRLQQASPFCRTKSRESDLRRRLSRGAFSPSIGTPANLMHAGCYLRLSGLVGHGRGSFRNLRMRMVLAPLQHADGLPGIEPKVMLEGAGCILPVLSSISRGKERPSNMLDFLVCLPHLRPRRETLCFSRLRQKRFQHQPGPSCLICGVVSVSERTRFYIKEGSTGPALAAAFSTQPVRLPGTDRYRVAGAKAADPKFASRWRRAARRQPRRRSSRSAPRCF
jgi:hypothetical protein